MPDNSLSLKGDETFETAKAHCARFGKSEATACRERRDGTGPPFIVRGTRILYPLSLALEFYGSKLVRSTSEVPNRGDRYAHLPAARDKAREAKRNSKKETA